MHRRVVRRKACRTKKDYFVNIHVQHPFIPSYSQECRLGFSVNILGTNKNISMSGIKNSLCSFLLELKRDVALRIALPG